MDSKLTQLAEQRSTLDYEILSKQSIRWFQEQVRNLRNPSRMSRDIIREQQRKQSRVLLGNLYFFAYNPKYADTLPYYDIFPLVLILKKMPEGFLGINFHYLPPILRAGLLDALMPLAVQDDEDEGIERIKITNKTYDMLASSRRFRAFLPCMKHYLYEHMGTRPLKVFPNEWESSLFLPVERFQKQNKSAVYKESVRKIRKK
jgi:hypothetical protein